MAAKLGWQPKKWLKKKSRKGVSDYPVGTVAFYGPDDRRASKVAVGIIPAPEHPTSALQRWFDETGDIRNNEAVLRAVAEFLREHDVRAVVMTETIIGCPHEEGIDYEGEVCPKCPFWAGRDRWTGVFNKR
jgi:hypothetical protein